MRGKFEPKFSKADINKMVEGKLQALYKAIISRLEFVGEHFVINTRLNGNYKDRTGNLRSSTGYVILRDGFQLSENFTGRTKEGVLFAKKAIDDIRKRFPKGFVLIGVAGMVYAAAVESKGYDVITNSSIQAANDLRRGFKELEKKLKR